MFGLHGEIGANAIMNVPLRTELGKDPELTETPDLLKARKKFAITISTVSYLQRFVHFQNKRKLNSVIPTNFKALLLSAR